MEVIAESDTDSEMLPSVWSDIRVCGYSYEFSSDMDSDPKYIQPLSSSCTLESYLGDITDDNVYF